MTPSQLRVPRVLVSFGFAVTAIAGLVLFGWELNEFLAFNGAIPWQEWDEVTGVSLFPVAWLALAGAWWWLSGSLLRQSREEGTHRVGMSLFAVASLFLMLEGVTTALEYSSTGASWIIWCSSIEAAGFLFTIVGFVSMAVRIGGVVLADFDPSSDPDLGVEPNPESDPVPAEVDQAAGPTDPAAI
jgi:hypothetical protein